MLITKALLMAEYEVRSTLDSRKTWCGEKIEPKVLTG